MLVDRICLEITGIRWGRQLLRILISTNNSRCTWRLSRPSGELALTERTNLTICHLTRSKTLSLTRPAHSLSLDKQKQTKRPSTNRSISTMCPSTELVVEAVMKKLIWKFASIAPIRLEEIPTNTVRITEVALKVSPCCPKCRHSKWAVFKTE